MLPGLAACLLLLAAAAQAGDAATPDTTRVPEAASPDSPRVGEPALPAGGFAAGWVTSGPELRFRRHDLFGHINGGAELFLEFGFEELRVREYRRGGAELALESYRMKSPAAALGIYLASGGRETPLPGLKARHSGSRYQITILAGSRFVQVNNFAGDEALLADMIVLARDFLAELPEEEAPGLLAALPEDGLVAGSERLLRGPYSLEPIYTFGPPDALSLGGEVFAALGDYRDGQGESHTLILADYPSADRAAAVFARLRERLDPGLEPLAARDGWFSFRDRQGRHGAILLTGARLRVTIHLADPPTPPDGR